MAGGQVSSMVCLTRTSLRQPSSEKQGIPLNQEDHRAQFFGHYRREAEGYDREFMKKHDEDLNTTLIFVSLAWYLGVHVLTWSQAGLFSAVTTAFIIDVQPALRPNSIDETAALLRILIYKVDNTTFGDDTPAIPQWTGAPHVFVQVQAILYASLAASLLSAFLAVLGKQWLNRYASTDMRGTAIERSQNRQCKLDGIITWYFDYVMESLPLMLQAALLLLSCALSRYLWEVNVTVALVVVGVTSSGVIFFIFIIGAGTASESCPYQTPGSLALRYLWPKAKRILHSATSAFGNASKKSKTIRTIKENVEYYDPWWSRDEIMPFLKDMVLEVPCAITIDVYHLGKAVVWQPTVTIYQLICAIVMSLVLNLHSMPSTLEQVLDPQPTALDLRCISWMLQISLDKGVHLSTLKHLTTMMPLANFDPALVVDCFNTFIGCININKHKAAIVKGLEELAEVSALCFLRAFHQLSAADPASTILGDIRKHHKKVLPIDTSIGGLPWYHTMGKVCRLTDLPLHHDTQWDDFRSGLSAQQQIKITQAVAEVAQVEYQRVQHQKVPRQILHFALCTLSLHPPALASVIANCLSIIAIDLGCDISNIGPTLVDR